MNWSRLSTAGRALVLLAAVCASISASPALADDAMAVQIGTFENPVYIAVSPDRRRFLYVVERPGQIQLMRDEQRLAHPFLDIRDLVLALPDPMSGGEQGLLSVAFPSDYESSGLFYVAFTNNDGSIELDEFKRSAVSATVADRASRRILLVIPHPGARNHNGGQLQFGPDGFLYMSTGDGGKVDPRGENARNLNSLLGKILRINPLPGVSRPYRIPRSNPYVGMANRRAEIFAYGLRNPWRFSFDGERIAIADVGQNLREEVNILARRQTSGVNFGWPQYEGDIVFDDTRPGPDPATFPMFVYPHGAGRCAVVGGYVVHDVNLPNLLGRYIYGDTCTGETRSFRPRVSSQQAIGDRPTGIVLPGLTSFGQGFDGKIYAAQVSGEVWRLAPP
jgi:glucose/arabinose dehydrogenase